MRHGEIDVPTYLHKSLLAMEAVQVRPQSIAAEDRSLKVTVMHNAPSMLSSQATRYSTHDLPLPGLPGKNPYGTRLPPRPSFCGVYNASWHCCKVSSRPTKGQSDSVCIASCSLSCQRVKGNAAVSWKLKCHRCVTAVSDPYRRDACKLGRLLAVNFRMLQHRSHNGML